jgi:hypothetical protein
MPHGSVDQPRPAGVVPPRYVVLHGFRAFWYAKASRQAVIFHVCWRGSIAASP